MSHKQKYQHYRKQIRRQQLDNYFKEKRIALLKRQAQFMQTQTNTLSYQQLKHLSQLSETAPGIEQLKQQFAQEKITPYLHQKYANTSEQTIALHILSNLLIIPNSAPPSPTLTNQLLSILEGQHILAIENCLNALFNIMVDHHEWKIKAVFQMDLINKLNRLLTFQVNSPQFFHYLFRTIYQVLINSETHNNYKLLRKNLLYFLGHPKKKEEDELRQALDCFYLTAAPFPDSPFLIAQSKILPKLYQFALIYNNSKISYTVLRLLLLAIPSLTQGQAMNEVLPFLTKMVKKVWENISHKGKVIIVRIVYNLLESSHLRIQLFVKEELFNYLFRLFGEEDEQELLGQLVYLFCMVQTNSQQNGSLCSGIDERLERAEKVIPHNIQIMGYIRQSKQALRNHHPI